MTQPDPVSWSNSVLPIAVLAALAVIVPHLLVRKHTRSHWEVALTIWASAGVLMLASAGVYAALNAAQGYPLGEALSKAPLQTIWFFLQQSGLAAILWVPILALTWFGMAQGVERRRGEDAAKR